MVNGVELVVVHLGTVMFPFLLTGQSNMAICLYLQHGCSCIYIMMVSNTPLLYVLVAIIAAVDFISTVVLYWIIPSLVLVASNIIGNQTDYGLNVCSHVSILFKLVNPI